MKNKIIVINGPTLNLGERERVNMEIQLLITKEQCVDYAKKNDLSVNFYQSNIEGEIVEKFKKPEITWMD